MSSSFFTTPASQRKRKRNDSASAPSSKKRQTSAAAPRQAARAGQPEDDVSISGSDSEDSDPSGRPEAGDQELSGSEDSDEHETAAERRLKLAERYLENIRAEVREDADIGFDAEDIDRELIAARLKDDVAEEKGAVYRYIAQELQYSKTSQAFFRADTLSTLGVAACPPYVYTASKDMRLIKWELISPQQPTNSNGKGRRQKPKQLIYTRGNKNRAGDAQYQHHTAPILCLAASPDGKLVVSGGDDHRLIVWDARTLTPLKVFTQHRAGVTALAFRGKTNQLFSSSRDRTVKIWNLDELAYIETLFGHQDEIVDVAAVGGTQERCVSVGARDRTARLWKVVEESQLVFRGGGTGGAASGTAIANRNATTNGTESTTSPVFAEGSLDRVAQIDTQLFVTGSDSGSLSLFSLHKKKPMHVHPLAHGFDPPLLPEQSSAEMNTDGVSAHAQPTPRWITALRAIPFSDLFVTGSWDGCIRVWRVTSGVQEEEQGKGKGQRRIEFVAALSLAKESTSSNEGPHERLEVNGSVGRDELRNEEVVDVERGLSDAGRPTRGVINDIAVFERGDRGKDGICIIAAVGTEPRLGRWMKSKGKNGAVVFEIPRHSQSPQHPVKSNGLK